VPPQMPRRGRRPPPPPATTLISCNRGCVARIVGRRLVRLHVRFLAGKPIDGWLTSGGASTRPQHHVGLEDILCCSPERHPPRQRPRVATTGTTLDLDRLIEAIIHAPSQVLHLDADPLVSIPFLSRFSTAEYFCTRTLSVAMFCVDGDVSDPVPPWSCLRAKRVRAHSGASLRP